MVFVSVTRLRLRKLRFLPHFLLLTQGALTQNRRAEGFLGGSLLADRRRAFWTLTAWRSQADMRAYMTDGPHRRAMPHLLHWCDEASVVHWEQDDPALPSWVVADRRMRGEGRPSKVRAPGPDHLSMTFAPPRLSAAVPITAHHPG